MPDILDGAVIGTNLDTKCLARIRFYMRQSLSQFVPVLCDDDNLAVGDADEFASIR